MAFDFRIYVAHIPYRGPATPAAVHEWVAQCIDPAPAITVSTVFGNGVTYTSHNPFLYGDTREEAIEAVKADLRARLQAVREQGITVDQVNVEIEVS